jgi:hypothetical protein
VLLGKNLHKLRTHESERPGFAASAAVRGPRLFAVASITIRREVGTIRNVSGIVGSVGGRGPEQVTRGRLYTPRARAVPPQVRSCPAERAPPAVHARLQQIQRIIRICSPRKSAAPPTLAHGRSPTLVREFFHRMVPVGLISSTMVLEFALLSPSRHSPGDLGWVWKRLTHDG